MEMSTSGEHTAAKKLAAEMAAAIHAGPFALGRVSVIATGVSHCTTPLVVSSYIDLGSPRPVTSVAEALAFAAEAVAARAAGVLPREMVIGEPGEPTVDHSVDPEMFAWFTSIKV